MLPLVDAPRALCNECGQSAPRTQSVDASSNKLLFYTPSLGDGGGQRLWASLATAFYEAGANVLFAQDFEADEASDLLHPNIPRHTLGRNHARAVYKLAKLLRREQPDIALSAIAGSNLKLIAARILSGAPTKVIQTFHGHNEWKTGWLSYITARALPLTSRLSERTIAVSEPLKDQLVNTWYSAPQRTGFLSNPVFLPSAIKVPSAQDLNDRPPIILSIGRLTKDKDYPTLIKAFAKLSNKTVQLVLVGKGPEEKTIRTLVLALRLGDRVRLNGFAKDPWPFYADAKCFALSSSSESFGNVIVEALAHGLPVVATQTDGAKHILSSPQLGQVVPVGDATALANAITQTLDAPGDPAPRARHAQTFSLSARLSDYEHLIADVLKAKTLNVGGQRDALT